MKPRIVPQNAGITAWRDAKPENLTGKVQRITRELQGLQDELYSSLADETGGPGREFASLASCSQEVSACKAAVDQLRQALWLYLNAAREASRELCAHSTSSDPRHTANRSTKISHCPANLMESGSFFDRLNLVIEGYIQMNGLSGRRKSSPER